MVNYDDRHHTFVRSLLAPLFTPSRLKAVQPYITDLDFRLSLPQIYAYSPKNIERRNSSTGGDSPLGNLTSDSMRVRRRVEAKTHIHLEWEIQRVGTE